MFADVGITLRVCQSRYIYYISYLCINW